MYILILNICLLIIVLLLANYPIKSSRNNSLGIIRETLIIYIYGLVLIFCLIFSIISIIVTNKVYFIIFITIHALFLTKHLFAVHRVKMREVNKRNKEATRVEQFIFEKNIFLPKNVKINRIESFTTAKENIIIGKIDIYLICTSDINTLDLLKWKQELKSINVFSTSFNIYLNNHLLDI